MQQTQLDKKAISWLDKYLRYTNYIGAAQLYLKENCLLRKELKKEHLKDRILGHWGTVPGLNFIWAHLNYLIYKHKPSLLFVAGPGHGAPAVIANLFAEKSFLEYYPELTVDEKGTSNLIKRFSWPGGFPSHTNPGTPGTILEGGELGYCLSTSYGAVFDNPDLIVACVVGDGEAESGPLAASWHSNKYLNPKDSGAVLPILHANGYKITGPTIYATMSDDELTHLFTGFGYEVRIVDDRIHGKHNHEEMISALEWAYQTIRNIQKKARSSRKPYLKPKWPMIVYRSLKGWSGIIKADGHKVEGTYHSHGIPISDPKTNDNHFKLVRDWLYSYKINELIDSKGKPLPEVIKHVPQGSLRMGMNKHAIGGKIRKELKLPSASKYETKIKVPGEKETSNTSIGSDYMRDIYILNNKEQNFRFMCPDETESNKFQSLFQATKRAYMWPLASYDEHIGPDGRVMEILSEHTLQGWLEGYLLTGRHGIFATYEAFATIVSSMVDQYAKFLKYSSKIPFRKPISSLNYILTSVGWRQEHNGYSHQNPGFISGILEKHGKFCSVYLPPDANSLIVTLEDCFKRTNAINVIVANKANMPQWLTIEQAKKQIKEGIAIWDFMDKEGAKNPDIVLASAGDVMVQEQMAAMTILQCIVPELKVRIVNVSELTAMGVGDERHPLSCQECKEFSHYFTKDKPVIFSFHGYPGAIKQLICGHQNIERFSIFGYLEEGTTTTPFDMMVLNKCSRFDLAMEAIKKGATVNVKVAKKSKQLITSLEKKISRHKEYIKKYGKDMDVVENWDWKKMRSCEI